MIRIEVMWLAAEPIDMRAGADRLPTQLSSRIEELLPHRWQPASNATS
jgi:hypothetical protein